MYREKYAPISEIYIGLSYNSGLMDLLHLLSFGDEPSKAQQSLYNQQLYQIIFLPLDEDY